MPFAFDSLAQRIGAIFGFFAVLLGALSAHGSVHDFLVAHHHFDYWQTALFQQMFHALALLALGQGTVPRRGTVICWLIGVVLFSGSLYVLALDSTQHWAGPLTPLGGLFLLGGWALLWFKLLRKPTA